VFPDQPLLLRDDGKTQTVLQLLGRNLTAGTVKVQLNLKDIGLVAYPTALTVTPDGTSLNARFASLTPLGWTTSTPKKNVHVQIEMSPGASNRMVRPIAGYFISKEPEGRSFDADIPTKALVARGGIGRVSISLHGLKAGTKVLLEVSGADVTKAEIAGNPGQSLPFEKGAWLATQEGRHWLELANLAPGHPVKITLRDGANTATNFILAVTDARPEQ
jgi:hypothetical protein